MGDATSAKGEQGKWGGELAVKDTYNNGNRRKRKRGERKSDEGIGQGRAGLAGTGLGLGLVARPALSHSLP